MYDVSILIATHQRAAILRKSLEKLARLEIPPNIRVQVVIVPNGCTDDTVPVIESMSTSFSFAIHYFIQPEPNLNRARNRCLTEASGEILAFIDDDSWVSPRWLKAMLDCYKNSPADLVGGRVELLWESGPPAWNCRRVERLLSRIDFGNHVTELYKPNIAGANFSFRRSVVDHIGVFAEGLDRAGESLLSGGDTEFVSRALRKPYRLFYAPDMLIHHWIPKHRVTVEYLSSLSFSRGSTAVGLAVIEARFKPFQHFRGGLRHVLFGAIQEFFFKLNKKTPRSISGRLLRKRGAGIIDATFRFLRKSPSREPD